MIRLGKFTDAIQAGDERRSSLRKENATLYSEFISQNPGASLEERTKFANNLIQQTGVGSRGLPTKSTMKGAVDKYQKEEARKAAAAAKTAKREEQAAIRQQQEDISLILKNAALNGDSPEQIKATMEALGIDTSETEGYFTRLGSMKFDNWANENKSAIAAYFENPTSAGYDALKVSGGADFADEIEGRFGGQFKAVEARQKLELEGKLRDLAQDSKDQITYDNAVQSLLDQYPPSVQSEVQSAAKQSKNDFSEKQKAAVSEEVVAIQSELDLLSRQDNTEEDYKNKRDTILRKYSQEAQSEAAQNIVTGYDTEAQRQRELVIKTNKDAFSSDALFNLNELAMNPATTQEALTARINKDKRDATAGGFDLGETYGEDAQAKFDEKKTEREDVLEDRVTSLVGQRTEAALNADAYNDTSFKAVRAKLEADLSASEGRNVVLNPQQIKLLQAQFDKGTTQLQKNMTALATGQVKDITQYASAVAQSKKEFVDSFVIQMQAGSNGGVANARMRFGTLAGETYDNIISAIREQNNQSEAERIRTAVTEMNAARDTVTLSDAVKANKALLENPTIIGTANKDEIPGIVADISQDLLVKATRMASELDIPLTEEVYEQMVLNLANGEHVPGQKFDPNLIRASLLNAFGATVDNAPNGGLERMAFQEALEAVGHDMLSLSQATPAEFRAFGQEFKKARTQMATETYDIFGSSFAEDVERSTPLVQDATKVSVDNDPKIAEALALMEPLLSLSVDGYIAADPPIDVINEAATSIGNLVPTLAASIEDIDTELRRLDALSRTSIYKTSEHAQSVTERIQQLTALRNANQNTISQIEYAQEKYKELAAKDIADRDQAQVDQVMDQAQAEFDAAIASGERINPRTLSPAARSLLLAKRKADAEAQRESNGSWFSRNILGPKWQGDQGE